MKEIKLLPFWYFNMLLKTPKFKFDTSYLIHSIFSSPVWNQMNSLRKVDIWKSPLALSHFFCQHFMVIIYFSNIYGFSLWSYIWLCSISWKPESTNYFRHQFQFQQLKMSKVWLCCFWKRLFVDQCNICFLL